MLLLPVSALPMWRLNGDIFNAAVDQAVWTVPTAAQNWAAGKGDAPFDLEFLKQVLLPSPLSWVRASHALRGILPWELLAHENQALD